MGTKPQRLCINCKHHKKQYGRSYCFRVAKRVHTEPSLIDGSYKTYIGNTEWCTDERIYRGPERCGPDAKFYEEARLTKRLIALFKA